MSDTESEHFSESGSDIDEKEENKSIEEDDGVSLEPFDFKNLPPHACEYCGVHDVESVVKCVSKGCNKWFCNNKGTACKGSHIILHLVKSKHKEIILHPDNQLGVSTLECYVCGGRNIFLLGFVTLQESQVALVCRMPCLTNNNSDLNWDPNDFTPLIQEKSFAEWLVKPSSEKTMRRARPISYEQITTLEEMRKNNPNIKFEELTQNGKKKKLKEVLLKYEDGYEYLDVFLPLIKAEAEHDKKIKESQTQSGVKVRWDASIKNNKKLAYFVFASKEDFETNLLPGNELRISCRNPDWSAKGHVTRITANEEVCLELDKRELPQNTNGDFSVEFVWKRTTFERIKKGLKRFHYESSSLSSYLYYRLLGQEAKQPQIEVDYPLEYSAPNLPQLNIYQVDAVKKALKSGLCLIQGPPGTGKTVTSATIVYHLAKNIQRKKSHGQILVCAPSNIVVDQLAEKISMTGLKVVRLCSKSREAVSSSIEHLTLHNQVRMLDMPEYSKMNKLLKLFEDRGELAEKDEDELKKLKREAEYDILESADVICCTCITAADPRLNEFIFQHVLIDEATQSIEPECLLPMLHGAKQVILVGDHRQLGPVITCRETKAAGLDKSLFERLVSMGIRPVRLQVQYRMHPELTVFPSNTFYEGTLQNGVTISDRMYEGDFPWPNKARPMFFFNLLGAEEISASGTSFLNRTEAAQVEKVVNALLKSGVKASNLGIITPYKGQRAYIVNYLAKNGQLNPEIYKAIEVASVDGFQGREKDYIIISCVRSNEGLGIGFLTDPRRMNVTLTRARYGLIICGNAKVLARDNLWNSLLNYYKENEVLVEGSLTNLKQSTMKFRPPQKYIPERRYYAQKSVVGDDARSMYSGMGGHDVLNNFDTLSEVSLSHGFRESQFGFNYIPDLPAFKMENFYRRERDDKSYREFDDSRTEDSMSSKYDPSEDQIQNIATFLPQALTDELNLDDLGKKK